MTTCGCKVNAPEADPLKFACPCGDHCADPKCVYFAKLIAEGKPFRETYNAYMDKYGQRGRIHR